MGLLAPGAKGVKDNEDGLSAGRCSYTTLQTFYDDEL